MFTVSTELKTKVDQQIAKCIDVVNTRYNCKMPVPTIKYDINSSRTGGLAYYSKFMIRLNPVFLNKYQDEYIQDTVTHELAHLATDYIARKNNRPFPQSHGPAWKNMMRMLGRTPTRCHNYEVPEGVTVGKQKEKFNYKCDRCGSIVVAGPIVHRKLQGGHVYTHSSCGGTLTYVASAGRVSYKEARSQGNEQPATVPTTPAVTTTTNVADTKTVVVDAKVPAFPKTGTKMELCYKWYCYYKAKGETDLRRTCIAVFTQEVNMTPDGASTYYNKCRQMYNAGV